MNMRKTICLLLLIITICQSNLNAINHQNKQSDNNDPLKGARISFMVKDVETGKIIMENNPYMCVTPASVTKIITTASAIEILGADFRFETKIKHDGHIDDNGVLHGNLYIVGDGDPTLGSSYLGDRNFISDWCRRIKNQGITHITGNIIADARCYDHCAVPISWCWEDMGTHYAPGVYGLSAYDNTFSIIMESHAPESVPSVVGVYPNMPDLVIINKAKVLRQAKDSIYVFGIPYDQRRIIDGGMPANRSRYPVRCDIGNPPLFVAQNLKSTLPIYGILCDGKATDSAVISTDSLPTLVSYKSPELSDIIKKTNFKSNNMYAEHIFKHIGLSATKSEASNMHAASVIKDFWTSKGIDFSTIRLDDGSGLSPQNAYSASLLVDILCYMHNSNNAKVFYESLPTAGKEGTVAGFLYKTEMEGKAKIKSGSMSNVQCYSGYINAANGHRYAFAAMINFYGSKRKDIRNVIKQWLLEAYRM